MNKIIILGFYISVCVLGFYKASAQQQQDARQIVDKAMNKIGTGKFAIYFEALGYGLKKPQEIFSLPAYKVYKGGYFYNDDKRFELSTGIFKGVSDGNLMVFINEEEKSMVIDSVRNTIPTDEEPTLDMFMRVAPDIASNVSFVHDGKEILKGTECYRIKTSSSKDQAIVSYYYISIKDNKLVMMADYHDQKYDVYWIRKITSPPVSYNYEVKIPKKEVSSLYGYEVFDMRFMVSEVRR